MDHFQDPNDDPEDEDERVGYCKPPRHTRWKPRECPNPFGRPRKAKGRRAILGRIANELCEVRVGKRVVTMTRLELLLTAVRNATANGDPGAQKLFDKLLNEVSDDEGASVPKGVLIAGEKLSQEEWEAEYGYLGRNREPPPSRKRGLMPSNQGVPIKPGDHP